MNTPEHRIASQSLQSVICVWLVAAVMALTLALPNPCSAQVTILTVGPHGMYPTIQGALAGVVNGSVNYILIESGTYVENVVIANTTVVINGGEIHLSGGWDQAFATQTADWSLTTIDGNGIDRCLYLGLNVTSTTIVSISNLTITGGQELRGGGLLFTSSGNVRLEISDCRITANTAVISLGSPAGGGLYASMSGSGNSLLVHDTDIDHNLAWFNASGGGAVGGGAHVSVTGPSPVDFERVEFVSNQAEADGSIGGAGLYLSVDADAVAWVTDCFFLNNQALSSAGPQITGAGLDVETINGGWAKLSRNRLFINNSQTGAGDQLHLYASGTSELRVEDTVVAGGDEGVSASAHDSATLELTNLTVVDNVGRGLHIYVGDPTPTASVHNTITYGNGTDLDLQPGTGTIANSHNLVGIDPVFNPVYFNFKLSVGSPAENAGTNSPPAGLGVADCDGAVRVIDGTVDIGAYEGIDVLFSDGFALGTRRWSEVAGD